MPIPLGHTSGYETVIINYRRAKELMEVVTRYEGL